MAIDVRNLAVSQVNTPAILGDGLDRAIRALRDGTLSVADFKFVCSLQGVLWTGLVGTGVTPVIGHTAFSNRQPWVNIDVPAGTTIIVLPFFVYLQTSAGTLTNVIAQSINNHSVGAGTSTEFIPENNRTDKRFGSVCKFYTAYSGNGNTAGAGSIVLTHYQSGYPFADATGNPTKLFTPDANWTYPVIVGPGVFQIHCVATTTAPTGYAQVPWIELPSSVVV